MMTESVDQSFQKVPRDPRGIYGGMSPLPHEKASPDSKGALEDGGLLGSSNRGDNVNINQLLGSSAAVSNHTDMMEKKQLIVKPPVVSSEDRRNHQRESLSLNLKSTEREAGHESGRPPAGTAQNKQGLRGNRAAVEQQGLTDAESTYRGDRDRDGAHSARELQDLNRHG